MKLDFRTKFLMSVVIATVCISGDLLYKYPYFSFFISSIPFILALIEKVQDVFKGNYSSYNLKCSFENDARNYNGILFYICLHLCRI